MSSESKTKPASNTNTAAADPSAAIVSFGTQWLEQSARGTQAMLEAVQSAGDPQQVQRQWLRAASRSLDDFMRTPVFLEAMRRNLKGLTDMKGLQDQVLQGAAGQLGVPTANDI